MKSDGATAATVCATALAGLAAGSMAFASAVDVRGLLRHVRAKHNDLIRTHFQLWWPCGRDWMVPLIGANAVAHVVAYAATKDTAWLAGGAAVAAIGPYTGLVLGKDIGALRKDAAPEGDDENDTEFSKTVTHFCNMHHVRTGLAFAGFASGLAALTRHAKKSA